MTPPSAGGQPPGIWSPPFGPLNRLHTSILTHARPYALTPACGAAFLFPLVLVWVQAYLLLFPGTRVLRSWVGAVALVGVWKAWTGWRFTDPALDLLNHSGWFWWPIAARVAEWSLLKGPVYDPLVVVGARSRIFAALDLCINMRMVGLGAVGLEPGAVKNEDIPTLVARGASGARANGAGNCSGVANGNGVKGGVTVPLLDSPSTSHTLKLSRPGAVARHVARAALHLAILDAIVSLRVVLLPLLDAGDTGADMLASIRAATFCLHLPLLTVSIPGRLVAAITPLIMAAAGYALIAGVYHFVAAVTVGSGTWAPGAWPDLFDAPWKADSMCALWGRRWHQLFRHQFTIIAASLASLLRLPSDRVQPGILLPAAFLASAAMHALGGLAASSPPSPGGTATFFLALGAGCSVEAAFRHMTGAGVRGWAGRVWLWSFAGLVAPLMAGPWLDAAVGSAPPSGPVGQVMRGLAGWIDVQRG